MSHLVNRPRMQGERGWILLEVMVAAAILGLLIAPLAGALQTAVSRAHSLRERAAQIQPTGLDEASAPYWAWGARVVSSDWSDGGDLRIRCEDGDARANAGLWVDGWFQGQWLLDSNGSCQIPAATFSGGTDSGVVVRVRVDGSGWGPPWRCLLAVSGGVAAPEMTRAAAPGTELVVHPRFGARPVLEISWVRAEAQSQPVLPLVYSGLAAGSAGVGLRDADQSWFMEDHRALDLYF